MQVTREPMSTRPFHETIVKAIRQASSVELECLATLIKATSIPEGHQEIIAAWNQRRKEMCWGTEDLDVPAHLLEQQRSSAAKALAGKGTISLDDLQQETERLLAFLRDRQPGLMTWNGFMRERLQRLHGLISQALRK